MMEVKLNNGISMPAIGFGTAAIGAWQADSDQVTNSVICALKAGYRHIDTAAVYGNERGIGKAIQNCGIPREELFVVSKVWMPDFGFESSQKALAATLQRLGLEYLDLYLIHWPLADKNVETWKGLEKLYHDKKVRAIGVSNFRKQDLEQLESNCEITPCCNQIELHPYFTQLELRTYCQERNIQVVSWSPLGTGEWSGVDASQKPLNDPVVKEIAEAHNVSTSQVLLRWHQQHGLVPIPKSQTPKHIEQNFDLQNITLSDDDMSKIDGLNKDHRFGVHPDEVSEKFGNTQVPS